MKYLVLLFCISLTSFSHAEQLEIEYASFYSHVRKLANEDTQALQFAFGFKRVLTSELCVLDSAQIVTDKQTIPLPVTDEYRFTVPSERALKLADAKVIVELGEAANRCDMSVQLETKPEYLKTEYDQADLVFIYQQYEAFFNEMGSFLSFMMPSVKGLRFQFADPELDHVFRQTQATRIPSITKGMLVLEEDTLKQLKQLTLPKVPLRITALASK